MKSVTFFGESERIDDAFRPEMLEKFKKVIARIKFFVARSVFNATFSKHVGEGDDGHQSVSDDFLNANHGVVFELNVHGSVVLVGHVEQVGVVSENLAFGLSNFEQRALAVKENDGGVVSVDGSGLGEPAGQQDIVFCDGLTVVVSKKFAELFGIVDDKAVHKESDAVENGGELNFAGHSLRTDLAGESAIDDSGRCVTIAFKPFGDTNGKNGAIEHGKRTQHLIAGGVENLISGADVAVLLVVVFFDSMKGFAVEKARDAALAEFKNDANQFFVELDANFGRIDLSAHFFKRVNGIIFR